MVIPVVIGALGTVTKGLIKGLRGLGNKRMSGDHQNYGIVEIGQNMENLMLTCCQSDSSEKPSTDADVKTSQRSNNNNNNDNNGCVCMCVSGV